MSEKTKPPAINRGSCRSLPSLWVAKHHQGDERILPFRMSIVYRVLWLYPGFGAEPHDEKRCMKPPSQSREVTWLNTDHLTEEELAELAKKEAQEISNKWIRKGYSLVDLEKIDNDLESSLLRAFNAGLEAAAAKCEAQMDGWEIGNQYASWGRKACHENALAIRNLKKPERIKGV